MKRITRMYNILGEMIEASRENNPERVSLLNRVFDLLALRTWSFPPTETDLAYDNCRQSIVMSVHKDLKGYSSGLLEDAIERYSALTDPREQRDFCQSF